ncbi:unnamed protein product [Rhizophagus irregularis]|uniref:Uncharacterized protein n=1 Tax=Rhizophagus irregularis TaxID=588596 RepID=A0A915Z655_9GLOM|nr:unnamed protein product [Rhizophagus irregularis]CAB5364206.1 unnamed protein product [Rhizophagus irregularis]
MSETASTSKVNDIYQEIYRLGLTDDEKTTLYAFFTNNPDKKSEAEKAFTYFQDEVKVDILRNLLPPTQPAAAGIPGIKFQDKAIWVHYNEKRVFFSRANLEENEIFDVIGLKNLIKARFRISKDVTIRSENGNLDDSELVTGFYNTQYNALEVIVEGNDDEGSTEGKKSVRDIKLVQVEKAFQIEYQGTTLDIFHSRLLQFHDEWLEQINPYAPYLAIIQCSGSGKSRLVGELRTKKIFILYICKRNETSTGYPASTPCVQQIFEAIRGNKFGTLLSLAIKQIKARNWDEEEFWSIQTEVEHKNECRDFWNSIFELLGQQVEPSSDCSNKNFVTHLFPGRRISVVCCIDEAHELLAERIDNETHFVQWRRQIRKISWCRFFNILLSTNGKIGNFLPPTAKNTISARSHNFEVFPAYLDVNTMDALVPLAGNANKNYNPDRTAYLGIPLWGSLAQAGVSLTDLIHLASQKIRNFSKNKRDYLANTACTACTLALEVSPRIAEVDSLIASHMATAIGVSLDRTSILCTYPSDPILASGALKGIIKVGWDNSLDTLLELFSRGVVEVGERGELVNRILFLKAYVDAVNKHFSGKESRTYLDKVPLELFLDSLLCNEIKGLAQFLQDMQIRDAEIGFNHWTSLLATNKDYVKSGGNKFLSEKLVVEAYHRQSALKMPLGFKDIDHIIPFKHSTGYGIISIQNKNMKKTTFNNTTDITSLADPQTAFGKKITGGYKVIGIYIDLGLDDVSAEIKSKDIMELRSNINNQQKGKKHIIYIQGVGSFKCCNDEIGERLSKILFTRPWPLHTQWSMFDEDTDLEREDVIKSFLPLVFEQKESFVNKWQLM